MHYYNFDFLQERFPKLADLGRQIEDIFYQDPQTVLIKGRIFSEELLKEVASQHDDLDNFSYLKLVERIQLLEKEEILSKEIARSLDTIRQLGNKASHEYIDADIENAFKMHKRLFEISVWLMEVYGDYSFVPPKYRNPKLKSTADVMSKLEEKTSSLEEKLELILAAAKSEAAVDLPAKSVNTVIVSEEELKEINQEKKELEFEFDLEEGESYLLKELSKLKESSQEAIENSNQFSSFKDYLHVKRSIQDDLEQTLKDSAMVRESQLIFLCGSVGDGKSHLLAYLKKKHPEIDDQFMIHNDATESFDPQKSSLDTLSEVLMPFSDEKIQTSTEKLILAINLGVLHNFIESEHAKQNFKILTQFITEANVFEEVSITANRDSEHFHLISFSDYQPFELTENGPVSHYFSTLLERIVNPSQENPFYRAYCKDKENKIHGFFMTNYELLMLEQIRNGIINLLIQAIIKNKVIISTRALFNFIHDIVVPANMEVDYYNSDAVQKTEALLPNLIFDGRERSPLLAVISELDPIHRRSNLLDQILIELNNTMDIQETFGKYIDLSQIQEWEKEINGLGAFHDLSNASRQLYNKSLIRLSFFLSERVKGVFVDETYNQYLFYLYYFNIGSKSGIKSLFTLLKESIFLWNGKPKNDYVYIDKSNQDIQVAQFLNIKPYVEHLTTSEQGVLNRFRLTIQVAFGDENKLNPVFLEIDFPLYKMLIQLFKGYRPNKKDKEDCIQFVEFIEKVMKHGNKEKELLFVNLQSNKSFKLVYDEDFEEFTFRRE